jgi:hypothetical protein
MKRLFLLITALSILGMGFACGSGGPATSTGGAGGSPTEAYKSLYAAVKSKNIEAIKQQLTKKTIDFGAMAAQRNNTPLEKVYENGFSATTFSDTLPEIRDERVKDNMGAIEVWNTKESKWEDLPFMQEDGAWKLAVGELFAGSYKSPGRGRDALEKEAANALTNSALTPPPSNNTNAPIPVKKAPINMKPGTDVQ